MALAVCYEEKGELDKAIQALEQITTGTNDSFKEQAILSLARIYRLSEQPDKSDELLKDFINKYPASPFLPQAKAHVRSSYKLSDSEEN